MRDQAWQKAMATDQTEGVDFAKKHAATCSNCGAPAAGGKFCPECGKPFQAPRENCAKCNAKMGATAKFCPECGAPRA